MFAKSDFQHSFLDFPDPSGSSVSVFFYGCPHNCENCHNKEMTTLENLNVERAISDPKELLERLTKHCRRCRTDRVVLMGGEPLSPANIEGVKTFLKLAKNKLEICIYTGYNISHVTRNEIKHFKYVKTGGYKHSKKVVSEKTDDYFQLASTNQKIYDNDLKLLTERGKFVFNRK